jgi:hemin uptake protein HemP
MWRAMPDDSKAEPTPDDLQPQDNAPVIDVTRWFDDQREIVLELEGVRYRLRLTRRNKLILQK